MQIIVKLSDVIEFYRKNLQKYSNEGFNAVPDIYNENQTGEKTEAPDPFMLGLNLRFRQEGDRAFWLNKK